MPHQLYSSLIVGRKKMIEEITSTSYYRLVDPLTTKNLKEKEEHIKNLSALKIINKQSDDGDFTLLKRHNEKKLLGREKQDKNKS